jgi:hypothetical protein
VNRRGLLGVRDAGPRAADAWAWARGAQWPTAGVRKRGRRCGVWKLTSGSRRHAGSGLNDFKLFQI